MAAVSGGGAGSFRAHRKSGPDGAQDWPGCDRFRRLTVDSVNRNTRAGMGRKVQRRNNLGTGSRDEGPPVAWLMVDTRHRERDWLLSRRADASWRGNPFRQQADVAPETEHDAGQGRQIRIGATVLNVCDCVWVHAEPCRERLEAQAQIMALGVDVRADIQDCRIERGALVGVVGPAPPSTNAAVLIHRRDVRSNCSTGS